MSLLFSVVYSDCCEGESNSYNDNTNVCVHKYKDTFLDRYYCLEKKTVLGITFCLTCELTLNKGPIIIITLLGVMCLGLIFWSCNCCWIPENITNCFKPKNDYQPINSPNHF